MQNTLTNDTQSRPTCKYDCLIGVQTCPENKSCKTKSRLQHHIKRRCYSHTRKAKEVFHIDPPLESDVSKLFYESLNNGFNCKYCNIQLDMYATVGMYNLIPAISLDHIIPLTKGGSNKLQNLQLICHRCNIVKNKMHPDYFETIAEELKKKYGNEGFVNYLTAIYPSLFANEIKENE
jgi:5-methylcytosine-specific restriction endonuclease McrA